MKWIGALLLITTTTYIGFDVSQSLIKRTKQLKGLIHSLQILEAEMGYGRLPLQEVFQKVGKTTTDPLQTFYMNLASRLNGVVPNLIPIWEEELLRLEQNASLKQRELEMMRQFGQNLGRHTFNQQQKQIILTIHHLQRELEEAEEQRYKYENMIKTLGILIGIFIVLLII